MNCPFLIDPETGRVRFPELSLELCPLMDEEAFLAATASSNRDNLGRNEGWQRYSVRELISGDRLLGILLVFLHSRLTLVSFAYTPKDETWDNWSEATEAQREKEYQQELKSQVGDKKHFPGAPLSHNRIIKVVARIFLSTIPILRPASSLFRCPKDSIPFVLWFAHQRLRARTIFG